MYSAFLCTDWTPHLTAVSVAVFVGTTLQGILSICISVACTQHLVEVSIHGLEHVLHGHFVYHVHTRVVRAYTADLCETTEWFTVHLGKQDVVGARITSS